MILDRVALDDTIIMMLDIYMEKIEEVFGQESNIISYTGDINSAYLRKFREFIELRANDDKKDNLAIILTTPGGSAAAVEKMVDVVRKHYKEVYFIVPDAAMSAGTIFCMSGDKIYMDYASSLGPIDPQVLKNDRYVPALGYLDKVNELIKKSLNGTLSNAEFMMLQNLDLAELKQYEQAKDLSIDLLKKWLVTYKFKNWNQHRTTPSKKGKVVTTDEKEERARYIAEQLSDNNIWRSHGRYIGIDTLTKVLKLEIEDYSDNTELRSAIIEYHDLLAEFVAKNNRRIFFHTRIK